MLRRIRLKPLLALDGVIDLLRRDHALFHKPVRDHRSHRAVEEVQYPVVNASQADAQFVDPVAQEVAIRVPSRAIAPIGGSTCPVPSRATCRTTPRTGMNRLPLGRGRLWS